MKCQVLANDQTWRIPLIIPACDHRAHLQAQQGFLLLFSVQKNSNCLIWGNNRNASNFKQPIDM